MHRFHGNDGKYWKIFSEEQQKIYAKDRAETTRRCNKVTTGHTPNRPKRKREKRIRREFCD